VKQLVCNNEQPEIHAVLAELDVRERDVSALLPKALHERVAFAGRRREQHVDLAVKTSVCETQSAVGLSREAPELVGEVQRLEP
jgi:hypothetical protein